jgi:hypothetical protein
MDGASEPDLKLNCHTHISPLHCGRSPSELAKVRPNWMSFNMSTLHLQWPQTDRQVDSSGEAALGRNI